MSALESLEALNEFRLKQNTGAKPALSCFEFRAEGDFRPFVLFGGGRKETPVSFDWFW